MKRPIIQKDWVSLALSLDFQPPEITASGGLNENAPYVQSPGELFGCMGLLEWMCPWRRYVTVCVPAACGIGGNPFAIVLPLACLSAFCRDDHGLTLLNCKEAPNRCFGSCCLFFLFIN